MTRDNDDYILSLSPHIFFCFMVCFAVCFIVFRQNIISNMYLYSTRHIRMWMSNMNI